MHQKFVEILKCPETGEPLQLKAEVMKPNGYVETGSLETASGRKYPIVRGIPRFVSQELYSHTFGYEWTRWPKIQFEDYLKGTPMEGVTRDKVARITLRTNEQMRGTRVVEFGCGPGHFMDVFREQGAQVVGLDMSIAVDAARKNFGDNPDILIVQADLTKAPFKDGVFDGAFAIGVLHHIPKPVVGVKELTRITKRGGWLAVAVYTASGDYARPSVDRFRRFNKWAVPRFGYRVPLIYAYISAYGIYYIHLALYKLRLGSLAEYLQKHVWVLTEFPLGEFRACDTFDMVTPQYASTHTPEDVVQWFGESGCVNVIDSKWNAAAKVATKA